MSREKSSFSAGLALGNRKKRWPMATSNLRLRASPDFRFRVRLFREFLQGQQAQTWHLGGRVKASRLATARATREEHTLPRVCSS